MKRPKYKDCEKIKSYKSTVWYIEFENGYKEIAVWHKKAKIEELVKTIKMQNPGIKFTIEPVETGHFRFKRPKFHFLGHGKKLNQRMELVLSGDPIYDFRKTKNKYKKTKEYEDIPF